MTGRRQPRLCHLCGHILPGHYQWCSKYQGNPQVRAADEREERTT